MLPMTTRSIPLATPLKEINSKTSQWLFMCLTGLPEKSPSRVTVSASVQDLRLCEDILVALVENGTVPLLPISELPDISCEQMQQNLINKLIIKRKQPAFCSETIKLVFNHLIANLEKNSDEFNRCPEFYEDVINYILKNSAFFPDMLARITVLMADADNVHIMDRVVNTISTQPGEVIRALAFNFIIQNNSFFKGPLENGVEFINFYEEKGIILIFFDYFDKLGEVLDASKLRVTVTVDSQEITMKISELWNKTFFKEALEDESSAIYILRNTNHRAITSWNFRNQMADNIASSF